MQGHLRVAFFMAVHLRDTDSLLLSERQLLHEGGGSSRWHNFGLWPAPDYATACRALGLAVGTAAGLGPGQRVLSLGVGDGEELALWSQHFGCEDLSASDAALPATPDDKSAVAGTDAAPFDAIVCVDAAYHFSSRAAWLQACAKRLRPGGHIAFTDLCLHSHGIARWLAAPLLGPVMAVAGVDRRQLLSPAQQVQRLLEAGFEDAAWQDLSQPVLDGFIAFAAAQAARLRSARHGAIPAAWRRVSTTARALQLFRRSAAGGLGYGVLSARVRTSSADSAPAAH